MRDDTAVIDIQEPTKNTAVSDRVLAALDDIRTQLANLSKRVAGLEQLASMSGAESGSVGSAEPVESPVESSVVESPKLTSSTASTSLLAAASGITEEEVLAISAALAAWLGVHAHIRQIRLIRTGAWAQQGRVTIQASHQLYY